MTESSENLDFIEKNGKLIDHLARIPSPMLFNPDSQHLRQEEEQGTCPISVIEGKLHEASMTRFWINNELQDFHFLCDHSGGEYLLCKESRRKCMVDSYPEWKQIKEQIQIRERLIATKPELERLLKISTGEARRRVRQQLRETQKGFRELNKEIITRSQKMWN
jgi:hypothetical protein